MLRCGAEGLRAQGQHHVAHGALGEAAPRPVQAVFEHAHQRHAQPDQQDGLQGQDRLLRDEPDHPADDHRQGGHDRRHGHRQHDDEDHPRAHHLEITDDAPRQFTVVVLAVVFLGVEAFEESHPTP